MQKVGYNSVEELIAAAQVKDAFRLQTTAKRAIPARQHTARQPRRRGLRAGRGAAYGTGAAYGAGRAPGRTLEECLNLGVTG